MLLEVEKSSRILWYYLFTYGLAFLIVTISIAIDPFVYTRADYCVWMEQTNVFWSTFITPIIVFIVVSIVFPFCYLSHFYRHTHHHHEIATICASSDFMMITIRYDDNHAAFRCISSNKTF